MFGKKKKQKSGAIFTMELHRYQVDVHTRIGDFLHSEQYDGFNAVDAIKECRKHFKQELAAGRIIGIGEIYYPLRFTILIK